MIAKDMFTAFYDSFGFYGVAFLILVIATSIGAITAYVIELGDAYLD